MKAWVTSQTESLESVLSKLSICANYTLLELAFESDSIIEFLKYIELTMELFKCPLFTINMYEEFYIDIFSFGMLKGGLRKYAKAYYGIVVYILREYFQMPEVDIKRFCGRFNLTFERLLKDPSYSKTIIKLMKEEYGFELKIRGEKDRKRH